MHRQVRAATPRVNGTRPRRMPYGGGRSMGVFGRRVAAVLLLWAGLPPTPAGRPAAAAEPPAEPILRIEAEMHTALIKRIDTDAAGRFLVTGSDDKTARVWSLPEGRLLRVLRPPIGAGDEGKVYAVAMAPNGATVAVGGWTGWDWDGTASVYLFERESGRLLRRLTGLENVVNRLAFSPDGRFLAAGLGGSNGIRVWRVSDWRQTLADRDYGGDSYGLAFDRAGRLATTSYDGFVRLYGAEGRLLAKVRAPGGQRPYGIAFAPDGERLAVGYDDSTAVGVLSGRNLASLAAPDTRGVDNGNLVSVAWSADGRFLFAGGRYVDRAGTHPIRRWTEGGRGAATELPAARNTIMDLKGDGRSGVLFGAQDPAFGAFDGQGRRGLERRPETPDFRDPDRRLAVSRDGSAVLFRLDGDRRPVRFDLRERRLLADTPADSPLEPPRREAPGLAVTDWRDTTAPKLNGTPLPLYRDEYSRSLALAPDARRVLLGTEWRLRLFEASGRQVWRRPVPGIAWGVNVTGDGRLAVAAYGDGTVRWHRLSDGAELLALFVQRDGTRWVAWTPTGYYAASPGGEELIGWHVNRGADHEADVFGVARFRDTFYRPDVVALVLDTLDEAAALRQADQAANRRSQEADIRRRLPPVVTLLAPADGDAVATPQVTLRYRLRSPSGLPVTAVRAQIDGRPLDTVRDAVRVRLDGEEASLTVTIPPRDVTIGLIAETEQAVGEADTVRLRWTGPRPEAVPKPMLYVLAIGISDYRDRSLRLRWAAKDARDVAAAFRLQAGGLYREVQVRLLDDAVATRDAVLDGMDWLERQTTSRDVGLLFLAGHGVNDLQNYYYFLPVDADPDSLRRTAVPYTEIERTMQRLAGKAVFFVDTCHAGAATGDGRRRLPDIPALVNALTSAENGAVVFASSTGRQVSIERDEWQHGAFTKALLDGLRGPADVNHDGAISHAELSYWLVEEVKRLTNGEQAPALNPHRTAIPDFPLALVRN